MALQANIPAQRRNGTASTSRTAGAATRDTDHILIIGAGFAGLGMAIRLKQAGIHDFTILEGAERLGGTWRDNTYPGIACDIPSHLYSYSFEPNPDWSRFFGPQKEILSYLERCADKYGILPHIRFSTRASGASFDERTGLWTVETEDGQRMTARVVVSGAGHALTKPVYPDIPGRETFAGKSMHSSRWDHSYSLEGKSVAVVGTGASAIQIIPSIAPKVGRMDVYQRTASWVAPKPDREIPSDAQSLFRKRPGVQKFARTAIYWVLETMALGYVVEPRINKIREVFATRFLERKVRDPELRKKLTPNFRLGCKRILISNDYYDTLQRDNVELVTDGIVEIKPHSIVTKDGKERPVDVIIYATGFETAEAKPPFKITGRAGKSLSDAWKDGIEAYLGSTVPGFPNSFLLLGPNTGLGHSSMIFMMESQFNYVLDAIRTMREKGAKYVDLKPSVAADYNRRLQKRLERTVWNSGGCASWYLTSTGKNTTAWPGFTFEFRLKTRRFDAQSYEMVAKDATVATHAEV
jgi:cation diffusion facilitator CzcD-associated flavoprotein CzcO